MVDVGESQRHNFAVRSHSIILGVGQGHRWEVLQLPEPTIGAEPGLAQIARERTSRVEGVRRPNAYSVVRGRSTYISSWEMAKKQI